MEVVEIDAWRRLSRTLGHSHPDERVAVGVDRKQIDPHALRARGVDCLSAVDRR